MKKRPTLRIELDGTGKLTELTPETLHGLLEVVTALPGGMAGGRASVGLLIRLDDGAPVFAETSLQLLLAAASSLAAHYGENG